MTHRKRWMLLCFAGALGLVLLDVQLSLSAEPVAPFGLDDKTAHVLGYAALSVCVGAGVCWSHLRLKDPRLLFPLAASLVLSVGLVLEVVQYGMPGRNADPVDAVANIAGISLGLACVGVGSVFLNTRSPDYTE